MSTDFSGHRWVAVKYSAKRFGLGCAGDGAFMFLQAIYQNADDKEMRDAARLIAAAPTLIKCLTMGATMQTPEFLEWLADRLVTVYGEDPGVDFVLSLRDRAGQMRAARMLVLGE